MALKLTGKGQGLMDEDSANSMDEEATGKCCVFLRLFYKRLLLFNKAKT
jgi:hypothetical protein